MYIDVIHRLVELPLSDYVIPAHVAPEERASNCTASHVYHYILIQPITLWNKLPDHIVNITSLDNLKGLLKSHF